MALNLQITHDEIIYVLIGSNPKPIEHSGRSLELHMRFRSTDTYLNFHKQRLECDALADSVVEESLVDFSGDLGPRGNQEKARKHCILCP